MSSQLIRASSGGSSIGSLVSGGTPKRILYIDENGKLAVSSNLFFDGTNFGLGTTSPRGPFDVNVIFTIVAPSSGNMVQHDGAYNISATGNTLEVNIYAYDSTHTVYSATPLDLNFTDNGDSSQYYWQITWAAVAGASGYIIYIVNDTGLGNNGASLDVGNVLTSNYGDGTENTYGTTYTPPLNSSGGPNLYSTQVTGELISTGGYKGTFADIPYIANTQVSSVYGSNIGAGSFIIDTGTTPVGGFYNFVQCKFDGANSFLSLSKDTISANSNRYIQFVNHANSFEYFSFETESDNNPAFNTRSATKFYFVQSPGGTNTFVATFANANGGQLGIGNNNSTPTAGVHLPSGGTVANHSPLKFVSGSNLATAEAGAVEYDGSKYYVTDGTPTRHILSFQDTIFGSYFGGRLTCTSNSSVTVSDVLTASTIYYTNYLHTYIPLYDGTFWQMISYTNNTSLTLSGLTSGKNYDIFGFLSSGSLVLTTGTVWTNDTTRAVSLVTQNGILVQSGSTTRVYLGTIPATGASSTADSGGLAGTSQVGGQRFLFNNYNRVARPMAVIDTTANWSYTTDTIRQANGTAGNKVEYVSGDAATLIQAQVLGVVYLGTNSARAAKVGVGVDSTTTFSGFVQGGYFNEGTVPGMNAAIYAPITGTYKGYPGLGYHYISWNEKGADGTSTFLGNNGGDGQQSGLSAEIFC